MFRLGKHSTAYLSFFLLRRSVSAGTIFALIIGVPLATLCQSNSVLAQQGGFSQSAFVGANAIASSVRIEGATQGSGVLVEKVGDRYTVLTAWHVVSGNRPGEELAIFTSDGKQHQLNQGTIRQVGGVDLAELSFTSSNNYKVIGIGDSTSMRSGSPVYVSGFPLPTSAIPYRDFRFLEGKLINNSNSPIPNGYQLFYSTGLVPTMPGMSGGAVLNSQGQLVGIHGRSETDAKMTEQLDVAVKTGTNQAVPISFYSKSAYVSSQSSKRQPGSSASVIKELPDISSAQTGHGITSAASNEDIFLYRGMGSSWLCNARAVGVGFPKAVGIAAATYVQIISGRHGGMVVSAGDKKLTNKQLFSGAEFQIITGAMTFCPKEVPADVKAKVQSSERKQQQQSKSSYGINDVSLLSNLELAEFKLSSFAFWADKSSDMSNGISARNEKNMNIALYQGENRAASNEDLFLYRGAGSSYVCNARSAGVEFPKAVGIAAATYVQTLNGRHGGMVASVGDKKFTNKQLFSGAEFQIITGAMSFCPKEVPADVKAKVEKAMNK